MQVSVTCRHMDVTDALREHAHDKAAQILDQFPRIENIHIILDVEKKLRHIAEVVVRAKNHIHVEAVEETEDMYHSIDGAISKAERQLRKLRDKVQDHKHQTGLAEFEQEMLKSGEGEIA